MEKLVTINYVMETFGIGRTTVDRWKKKGALVQRKLPCSNKVYFTESSVNALINGKENHE